MFLSTGNVCASNRGRVGAWSSVIGLDPVFNARFFRAQIEPNKAIQRSLHDLWSTHPDLRPPRRPDLESEVRPKLEAITKQMLLELKTFEGTRDTPARAAEPPTEALADLHADALCIALAPLWERMSGKKTTVEPANGPPSGDNTTA
ncbi:hypothetical protein ACFQZ8_02915 [Micromonospora azadirachtae]|uniref:Uncharacterized protein n=1 Tax=Micromonospora azadirachtae TaxID=1970735 RepID=A0ABW2ZWC0_9ACTN